MYSVLIPSDTARKGDIRFTCHTTGQQHAIFVAALKEGLEAWRGESHKEITPAFEDYESESTMRLFIRSHIN
jgi:hypothetical protein